MVSSHNLTMTDGGTKLTTYRDLYVRAMVAMHGEDHSDPLSYFQLMGKAFQTPSKFPVLTTEGIHGKPYIEWNDGGSKKTDGWQGYCPHGVSKLRS